MTQPPPPPGSYPPPPPGGYPPQPVMYPPPPPGGYPPQPVMYPPPPPENHTTRNVVIGIVVVLALILIVGAAYAATRPRPSLPVIIPTVPASAEAPRTPKPSKAPPTEAPTEQPATEVPPTEQPPTQEPATQPPPTSVAPTVVPPTGPPPTETVESPGASTIPGIEDQEIVIGEPVVIGDSSFPQVALLVQNVSDLVKSYSLTGTFKQGDTITATATGFVGDHLPGTIRTPTLFIDGTPGASDTLTVTIDAMLTEDASTPEGDVAKQITFGKPTIITGDFPSIAVETTNGSDSMVSFSVAAGIMRDGVLVGVGSGYVSDVSPGQTKTASMYITGVVAADDQLILTVESVLIQ